MDMTTGGFAESVGLVSCRLHRSAKSWCSVLADYTHKTLYSYGPKSSLESDIYVSSNGNKLPARPRPLPLLDECHSSTQVHGSHSGIKAPTFPVFGSLQSNVLTSLPVCLSDESTNAGCDFSLHVNCVNGRLNVTVLLLTNFWTL